MELVVVFLADADLPKHTACSSGLCLSIVAACRSGSRELQVRRVNLLLAAERLVVFLPTLSSVPQCLLDDQLVICEHLSRRVIRRLHGYESCETINP